MAQKTKNQARIVQFRRGRHGSYKNQFLIEIGAEDKEQAKQHIGKEVVWKSSTGKEIKGKVSGAHGNSGLVRALFEKGLPGQALGTKVEIK